MLLTQWISEQSGNWRFSDWAIGREFESLEWWNKCPKAEWLIWSALHLGVRPQFIQRSVLMCVEESIRCVEFAGRNNSAHSVPQFVPEYAIEIAYEVLNWVKSEIQRYVDVNDDKIRTSVPQDFFDHANELRNFNIYSIKRILVGINQLYGGDNNNTREIIREAQNTITDSLIRTGREYDNSLSYAQETIADIIKWNIPVNEMRSCLPTWIASQTVTTTS